MILAGGLGTRLRAAVADRPKVMATVLGRPFVTFLLDRLAIAGITNVVLCTGYRAAQLEQELGTAYGPIRLFYSTEPTPLGTGGALARGASLCRSEAILALNGDSYCDADLNQLLHTHMDKQARATIQLAHMPDTSRYGQVRVDIDGRVTAFEEKGASNAPGWINAGIYCLSRSVLENVPPDKQVSIERDVFPSLIGHGLFAASGRARLLDIGTPESYAQAEAFLAGLPSRGREFHMKTRRFVVLDRDGTLIVERNYLSDPKGVELLPGVGIGLRRLAGSAWDLSSSPISQALAAAISTWRGSIRSINDLVICWKKRELRWMAFIVAHMCLRMTASAASPGRACSFERRRSMALIRAVRGDWR